MLSQSWLSPTTWEIRAEAKGEMEESPLRQQERSVFGSMGSPPQGEHAVLNGHRTEGRGEASRAAIRVVEEIGEFPET